MSTHYTSSAADEQALLVGLRAGDQSAVRQWYQLFLPKVKKLISQRVGVAADVEELVHDTFMSCLHHLPLFRGESGIWTWMAHVAQHEVADYFRKKYAKKVLHCLPLGDLLPLKDLHNAHEVAESVRTVLHQMTRERREVLMMKYLDRKSVKTMARELKRTGKSVEALLFRARQEFRMLYEEITAS